MPLGARIIECGCGTAQLSNFLSIVKRDVFATDICVNSLQLGQTFARTHGLSRIRFVQQNLFRPVFKPSRASHVHHWVDGAHLLASPVDRKSPVDAHVGVIATGRPGAHLLLQLFERADAT